MKTWKLLLLALVPGLWGWLCNWLTAVSLNGPAFLFTLAFYIQVPAAIVFCLWLGHLCGRSERSYPACLLLTQWPSLVSFALYVWQFHFVSSEARSFLLAGLGQYPGLPLFSLACRLVIPFSNHSWGPPETLAANALSLLMLAVLAFLKIGSQVYGNTPQGRIEKAKIMLSLPLVGVINQMNGAAQFANTMSVLLAAGITIIQAVDTTAKVMDNALLSEDVRSMREGIEQGRSLVECLRGKKYFPPTMVDMCSVGEETGELEETLDNVADYYTNEADYRIQRLLALLEPTMLVVLAIFAGIIVVSIYLPIFTMYDLM